MSLACVLQTLQVHLRAGFDQLPAGSPVRTACVSVERSAFQAWFREAATLACAPLPLLDPVVELAVPDCLRAAVVLARYSAAVLRLFTLPPDTEILQAFGSAVAACKDRSTAVEAMRFFRIPVVRERCHGLAAIAFFLSCFLCCSQYAPTVWVESVTADSYDEPIAVEEPAPKRHLAAPPTADDEEDDVFLAALIQAADKAAGNNAAVDFAAPAAP